MRALVLGSAAGGGIPQWNCRCRVCALAWTGDRRVKPRTQSSVAVTIDGASWVLLNASMDVRQQILNTPVLQPQGEGRSSPIAAVILTNADVDHAAGLLHLRERQPFSIWGTRSNLETLSANRIFDVVARDLVPRRAVALGEVFEPLAGLSAEFFAVPGKIALWLEEGAAKLEASGEGAVGVALEASGRRLLYIPGCARVTDALRERLGSAHALFFDGTLFEDNEMIGAGLGEKTGRRMGHMPIFGAGGTLEELAGQAHLARVFVHINNSNPILIEDSPEAQMVEAAGWTIAYDGLEVIP